jgi:hypothetical protein
MRWGDEDYTTLLQLNATQVYLITLPSHLCYVFRPVLGPSVGMATQEYMQEDTIEI